MKKSKIKYEDILSYDIILDNYEIIRKNTQHKDKIVKFDLFKLSNVHDIYKCLKNRNYVHSKYNIFLVSEPKYRIVMSENIKDKVINHIISNQILKSAIYPKLIDQNVATRLGLGTNAAIKLCKKYFLRMQNKYEKFYVLKFDIQKYFYNINHDILKQLLRKIYDDEQILKLLYITIDATDADYINGEIDKVIKREKLRLAAKNVPNIEDKYKELDKIPHYEKGKGLGIGSLSNQIYAVFYLNELDHYIKEKLKVKEYIRFMDDGIIFSNDLEQLKYIWKEIKNKVEDLSLTLNEKTKIYTSNGGFEFVGYRFTSKKGKMIVRIKNETKNRMKKKFKNLSKYNQEKFVRVKASYKGMVQYCTCKSLYDKYFKK